MKASFSDMKPLFAIGAVALALTGCRTGDALSTGRDGAIPTRLAFGADKAFAVLHVTDVQDNGKLPARSAAVLRAALAATRPQLVIHPDGSFETEIATEKHPFPANDGGKPYRPAAR